MIYLISGLVIILILLTIALIKYKLAKPPKSHWNYRVMAHQYKDEIYLQIHEVHYKYDVPTACGVEKATVGGETTKEIRWSLQRMEEANNKPVLFYGDKFPEEYKP